MNYDLLIDMNKSVVCRMIVTQHYIHYETAYLFYLFVLFQSYSNEK